MRCSGLAFRPASLCFSFFFSFFDKQTGKGKIKGEGSIKTAQSCGLSLKVSEAWVKGRESFFSFQTYFLLFVLFMTDLGLDQRRSSVTLMVMYTQIVSSWVLSGNRVHVKAKLQLWAGDCYFKLLPSWNTWGFFFHFIGFICVQENKWKRALFASFSFQWIERRGRKNDFVQGFLLARVTNIAFLFFFFFI